MMKTTVVAATVCVTVGLAAPALAQSYDEAYQAYSSGDYYRSRAELEVLDREPDPDVEYLLGLEYINGLGGVRRGDAGVRLIRQAAEAGNSLARDYLAKSYFDDHLRYIDEATASEYRGDPPTPQAAAPPAPPVEPSPPDFPASTAPPPTTDSQSVNTPSNEALAGCIVGGDCGFNAENAETTEQAAPPSPQQPASGSVSGLWVLLAGATAVVALVLFAGVKCPNCGRRRKSHVEQNDLVDEYISTRMRSVSSETERRNPHGELRDRSRTTSQVPITVTVRKYREHRFCRNCEHRFTTLVTREL